MRVISIQPAARRGGPSMQHLNFARESIRQGIEHHAIVREDHEMLSEYREVFSSVTLFEPVNAIVPRSVSPLRQYGYFRLVNRLADLARNAAERVDADMFWSVNDAFLPGPLAAKRSSIPALSHFLGMTSYQPRPVGLALMAFHKKYSQRLATCQDLIAGDLTALGYPEDRIDVVYNGIDVERFTTEPRETSQTGQPITIGMVANLDRRKGLSLFIQAAALIHARAPETRFCIAGDLSGDDTYLSEIRKQISNSGLDEHVHLEGSIPNMPEWFSKLDICCVPSLIEALSVACLEAMAASLPIVATNVGGNHIAVKHEHTGLLTRPADADDLAENLLRLINSPQERLAFGAAGRQLAESTFSISEVVTVLNTSFDRCLAGHKA